LYNSPSKPHKIHKSSQCGIRASYCAVQSITQSVIITEVSAYDRTELVSFNHICDLLNSRIKSRQTEMKSK